MKPELPKVPTPPDLRYVKKEATKAKKQKKYEAELVEWDKLKKLYDEVEYPAYRAEQRRRAAAEQRRQEAPEVQRRRVGERRAVEHGVERNVVIGAAAPVLVAAEERRALRAALRRELEEDGVLRAEGHLRRASVGAIRGARARPRRRRAP